MSGSDDDNHGEDSKSTEDTKKTADILAWPGKRSAETEGGLGREQAEDLVIKALSSITGRDPAELLSEMRAREAAETDSSEEPSNIINLSAARAARDAHSSSGIDIADLARAGFRAVMDELLQLQPHGGELVIDGAFMREHGSTLIGNALQQVGKALLAKRVAEERGTAPAETSKTPAQSDGINEPPAPEGAETPPTDAPQRADAEPKAPREPVEPPKPVEIRVDFGNLAVSLLSRLGLFRGAAVADAPPQPKAPGETIDSDDEPPSE